MPFQAYCYGGRRHIVGTVVMNALIAAGLTVIFMPLYEGSSPHQIFNVFLENLVYSQVIGILSTFTIPPVALRVWHLAPARRWPILVGCLIAVAAAGATLSVLLLAAFGLVAPHSLARRVLAGTQIAATVTLTVGIAMFVFESLRRRVEATSLQLKQQQLENERAQKLAAEARFSSLESRLRPHFLFNTINSVLELIREDPRGAERMLERLSRLLRYALDSQQRGVVTLGEEMRLVADYLEIEKMRFGARLSFSMNVAAEAESCQLPAYALQTLIENSMKYAVARRREGGSIGLRAVREEGSLQVEVSDDGPGFTRDDMAEGHGLDTLEKRLKLLYGEAGTLTIENGTGSRVRLTIPLGVRS